MTSNVKKVIALNFYTDKKLKLNYFLAIKGHNIYATRIQAFISLIHIHDPIKGSHSDEYVGGYRYYIVRT